MTKNISCWCCTCSRARACQEMRNRNGHLASSEARHISRVQGSRERPAALRTTGEYPPIQKPVLMVTKCLTLPFLHKYCLIAVSEWFFHNTIGYWKDHDWQSDCGGGESNVLLNISKLFNEQVGQYFKSDFQMAIVSCMFANIETNLKCRCHC